MNANKFIKLWQILLILPLVFGLACSEDEEPAAAPVASFQATPDEINFLKVTFESFSSNAVSQTWDFGDGNSSTDVKVEHTYAEAGTYNVTLTVTSESGATDDQTKEVVVTDPDQALTLLAGAESKSWKLVREGACMGIGPDEPNWAQWFSLTNDGSRNCLYDDTFTFYRDGTYEFDDAGTFWGEFGVFNDTDVYEICFDGTAANMINKDGADVSAWLSGTHQYSYSASAKEITLTGEGAWIGIPKLGTSEETTVPLSEVKFKATVIDGSSVGVDTLIVDFDYSGIGNWWKIIYVSYANPADEPAVTAVKADFTVATSGRTATFTNTSSGATSYTWDFGDGNSSTDENPEHTYAEDGTYSVKLTATDGSETGEVTKDVIIDTQNPQEAAPTPTEDAANVISIYSDTYTSISGVNTNPNWGQATTLTEEAIGDNNMLKLAGLNYQGIGFEDNAQDVSGKTTLHLDIWVKDEVSINVSIISSGAENAVAVTSTAGEWKSVDIPLTDYTVPDLSAIFQMKFDATGSPTVFVDNIYFY